MPVPEPLRPSGTPVDPRPVERFAARTAGMTASEIRALFAVASRPEVVSLAGGMPNLAALPLDTLAGEVAELVARDGQVALQYGSAQGVPALRAQICEVMALEGIHADPNDVVVTVGSQMALDLVTRILCDPGDVVLAEGPSYVGALGSFAAYQAKVVHVAMDAHGLVPELLREALRTLAARGVVPKFLYTIPNFHNPAGVTMSLERRERLIEIAHDRELLIVEDNPYGQIRFDGEPLPTLWELDAGAGWVIYLSTFSKILAPGTRVGWVAAPAAVLRKMNLGKQAADLCTSTVSQRLVIEYLKRHDWRDYVARLNGIYRLRRDALLRALEEEMPPEATWTRPNGGLFVWATLPDYIDTTNLAASALERHEVAFVPGRGAFLDGRGAHSMRLNFSGVPEATISEGVRRLGLAVTEMTELHRALGGS